MLRNFLNQDNPHTQNEGDVDRQGCTGAGEQWRRDLWPWPALQGWRRDELLETHASVMIPIRRSSQIKAEYERARGSQLFANEMTLAEFLAEMRADEELLKRPEENHDKSKMPVVSDPPYVMHLHIY